LGLGHGELVLSHRESRREVRAAMAVSGINRAIVKKAAIRLRITSFLTVVTLPIVCGLALSD
ncbi:MAG: hypothetical protein M1133_15100, partial [Armatimonadetes bacterium]|nr:hypothetical protein [Armatimonadota bacterium]